MIKKLLVIIPDRLSVLIQKGEVVPRYYNPCNLFDEVHIMMTNDDMPDPKLVQPMVGNAKLFIYNHPEPRNFFKRTLGWQPWLMKKWLDAAFVIASKISPNIIRCYGMHVNLSIGVYTKRKLNIPLVVSLHTHPFLDSHRDSLNVKNSIIRYFSLRLSKNLKMADLIMPVYQGIVEFLEKLGIKNHQVLYNIVGMDKNEVKKNYDFHENFKLISVGQQIPNKNPEQIIRALALLKGVSLDIVGTGILNENLKKIVNDLQINNRVKFIDSISHLKLCSMLKNYDAFVASIDCIGLSKTVIESFLAGLPVLLNINSHKPVPELNDSICLRVSDTPDGYVNGIKKIIDNKTFRIKLAENAYEYAWKNWDPGKLEVQHSEIYKKYIQS